MEQRFIDRLRAAIARIGRRDLDQINRGIRLQRVCTDLRLRLLVFNFSLMHCAILFAMG